MNTLQPLYNIIAGIQSKNKKKEKKKKKKKNSVVAKQKCIDYTEK